MVEVLLNTSFAGLPIVLFVKETVSFTVPCTETLVLVDIALPVEKTISAAAYPKRKFIAIISDMIIVVTVNFFSIFKLLLIRDQNLFVQGIDRAL
jgi:hypothetical protein